MERYLWVKRFDCKYYSSSYYDVCVNKYGVKGATSLNLGSRNKYINVFRAFFGFSKFKANFSSL